MGMDDNKKAISEEYQEFVRVANKLADKEYSPILGSSEDREERYTRHIIGMLEMNL